MGKIFSKDELVAAEAASVEIGCNDSAFSHQLVFDKITATAGTFTPKVLLSGAQEYVAVQSDDADLVVDLSTITGAWSIIYLGFLESVKLEFTDLNGSGKFTLSSGS